MGKVLRLPQTTRRPQWKNALRSSQRKVIVRNGDVPTVSAPYNRVLLENYYLPGDLERQIEAFVDHYNNHRYHESLNNLTPFDVYHGRGTEILKLTEDIKKQTIQKRRLQHQ